MTTASFNSQHPIAPFPDREPGAWRRLAESVFARNPNGIIICNAAGAIVDVNSAFCSITGYGRDEVIDKHTRLFQPWTDGPRLAMWKALLRHGVWQDEIVRRKKTGEIVCALLSIYAMRDDDQRPANYIGIVSDITPKKERQQRLAHYDSLTGLPKRELLDGRLRQALARASHREHVVAVCHLDIDAFKAINNGHGHHTGNRILVEIANRLRQAMREGDTLARLGGDEFVLLLNGLTSSRDVDCILQRLLQALAVPSDVEAGISVSASIGVTLSRKNGDNPDTLLRQANQAMYQAKNEGGATYHIFDTALSVDGRLQQGLLKEIKSALSQNEFRLHYQPKISLKNGTVVGAEALIRWQHPAKGLLLPADFLPALSHPGLAAAIDRWVVGEALRQMTAWAAEGLQLAVSVNVSAHLLQQSDLERWLADLLAAASLPASCKLELEILESAVLPDLPELCRRIDDCKRLGITFALDDFGTGYSSLTYLRQLPAATLKIDRSFVKDMLSNSEDLAIVEGILALAAAFGRQVVVEGVESAAHGRLLAQLGCDVIQGYGIAYPLPPGAIRAWISAFTLGPQWLPAGQ